MCKTSFILNTNVYYHRTTHVPVVTYICETTKMIINHESKNVRHHKR